MRLSLVAGLLLIVGGVVLMARGFAYTSQRSVLKVGDFQATLEEERNVSPWFGAGAIVLGIVIILAGERRRGSG